MLTKLKDFLRFQVVVSKHDVVWTDYTEGLSTDGELVGEASYSYCCSSLVINELWSCNENGDFIEDEIKSFKSSVFDVLQQLVADTPVDKRLELFTSLRNPQHLFRLEDSAISYSHDTSGWGEIDEHWPDAKFYKKLPFEEVESKYIPVSPLPGKPFENGINEILSECISDFLSRPEVLAVARDVSYHQYKGETRVDHERRLRFVVNYTNDEPLDNLYDYLKNRAGLIAQDTHKSTFKSVFERGGKEDKVDWVGSLALLNCLVSNLPEVFLPTDTGFPHFVAAADNFTHRGNILTSDQIRNNRYQKSNSKVLSLLSFLEGLSIYSPKGS